MNVALYELATYPTTFDFASWLVIAKTHGCDHVRFVYEGQMASWKYDKVIAWKRFANILIPMCRLAGMDFSVGHSTDGRKFPYHIGDVQKTYRKYGHIAKLKSNKPRPNGESGYIVLSLRESFRHKYRNSNKPEWARVKAKLEADGETVIVLDECELAPLDVVERMSIYEHAKMNLNTNGGPPTLCYYSDAPYLTFNIIPENDHADATYDMRQFLEAGGFPEGSQLDFRNTLTQGWIWKPDTYDNIMGAYGAFQRGLDPAQTLS